MATAKNDYDTLFALSRETAVLHGIESLLHWDQETMMPPAASDIRAQQLELLASLTHKRATGAPFKKSLDKLIDIKSGEVRDQRLDPRKKAALREWRRDYLQEAKLSNSFVKKFTKLTVEAQVAWRQARQDNSFKDFRPYLEKIVSLCQKKADLWGYKEHPYDALLDAFEPDATTAQISPLFQQLKTSIVPLINKSKQLPTNKPLFTRDFPVEKQLSFATQILDAIGYPKERTRLDLSTHPFSSSYHPTDSRITTRIHTDNPVSSILTVLHEAGHGMYAMGLPEDQYGSPLGQAISHGMHECQSRWWETRIGKSKAFWQHFLPLLKQHFPGQLDHISLEQFHREINAITPSLIRVEADEVTYPLHVILRFELEKALIEGSLKVKEVPEAWRAKMQELLGIAPKTDREGCLQDIHWSMGAFGYFPSYTLGNVYAAHLFKRFEVDHPDWQQRVAQGELAFIRDWQTKSVYQYGRQYSGLELLQKITGKPLTADAYITYLETKVL